VAKAYSSAVLNRDAESIWNIVKGFNNLPSWHPAFAKSDFDSARNARVIVLADESHLIETLEGFDNEERLIRYSITETELPIVSYLGTLKVTPESDQSCKIEWSAEFEAEAGSEDEIKDALEGVYMAGFEALEKM